MTDIFPRTVYENHTAITGKTGSGKTYTARGFVEGILEKKGRVCIIDPTGVWWGLKTSTTGKGAGFPIVVFGGDNADMQISGRDGAAIAEVVGTSSTPSIIDVSMFSGSDRVKFFTNFAETLMQKNRGPLHLIIDEAHLFAPQGKVNDPQSGAMLHAANNLVSLGRARGLRIVLITQRPAKLHKDSLSQVETLIALRLVAPQDRAAIQEWIKGQADIKEGEKIISSLPTLKTGEGWIWSPEAEVLKHVHFPKIKTFDSGRTPDAHGTGKKLVLAPIDLGSIQAKLATVAEDRAANDPDALRKKIAELQKQIKNKSPIVQNVGITEAEREKIFRAGFEIGIEKFGTYVMAWQATLASKVFHEIGDSKIGSPTYKNEFLKDSPIGVMGIGVWEPEKKSIISFATTTKDDAKAAPSFRSDSKSQDCSGPERKIIESLKFWYSIGHEKPTREQVACVAGYSAQGAAFKNPAAHLKSRGVTEHPGVGLMRLSSGWNGEAMSAQEAREKLLSVLSGPQKKIIYAFDQVGDEGSREDIANCSGYEAGGAAFKNPVAALVTLGILTKPGVGRIGMAAWAKEVLK